MDNKISGIYCIENVVTGQKYIGQAVNIDKRIKTHKRTLNNGSHPNKHLARSYGKYGINNFKFYIIEECNEDNLNNKEIYYIAKYKTTNPDKGYNKTFGGEGGRPTEETKQKIRENHVDNKGEKNPMYGMTGEKNPMWGKQHSEEAKKKISEAKKGENNPNYGKQRSEETRKKISMSQIGKVISIEARDKMRENHADVNGNKNPMYGMTGEKNKQSICHSTRFQDSCI
jgi:group I intron endonuclease